MLQQHGHFQPVNHDQGCAHCQAGLPAVSAGPYLRPPMGVLQGPPQTLRVPATMVLLVSTQLHRYAVCLDHQRPVLSCMRVDHQCPVLNCGSGLVGRVARQERQLPGNRLGHPPLRQQQHEHHCPVAAWSFNRTMQARRAQLLLCLRAAARCPRRNCPLAQVQLHRRPSHWHSGSVQVRGLAH